MKIQITPPPSLSYSLILPSTHFVLATSLLIKQEFILLHCEMLHCLKRHNTRHYATLWEVTRTLHCTMLCSDIDYKITFWKRDLWLAKSCFYNCMENKERFTPSLNAIITGYFIKEVENIQFLILPNFHSCF